MRHEDKHCHLCHFLLLHVYVIFDQYFLSCYIHPHGLGLYVKNSQTENLQIKKQRYFLSLEMKVEKLK